MYNFDYFDAFVTHTTSFPSKTKYENSLIKAILNNEQLFFNSNNNQHQIDTFQADQEIIDVYNDYQLLKQYVLENATLLKYEEYFKCRRRPNGMSSIKYKETYDDESALQSLFFPFMILKELLQAQQLMPKFPYKSFITLKHGQKTETSLSIHFDIKEQALLFNLDIICANKDIYYHSLGLGIAHGTYFDNMFFKSNLKQSLAYFDKTDENK